MRDTQTSVKETPPNASVTWSVAAEIDIESYDNVRVVSYRG